VPHNTIEKRQAYERNRRNLPHRKEAERTYAATYGSERTAAARLWKINNPEKARTWYGQWRGTSRYLLGKAKSRAKALGLDFSITIHDIPVPVFCPVLGIPLFPGEKHITNNSPTVDRIKLTEGYVPGNVRVISYRANRIKNDATIQEIEQVLCYLKRELGC
jgi:hypothetical protein